MTRLALGQKRRIWPSWAARGCPFPRDFVWTPANFTWSNGGEAVGLVPTRYPGSELSPDASIQLARKTDWVALGGEQHAGLGQRLLATDTADYGLLDLRTVSLANASG